MKVQEADIDNEFIDFGVSIGKTYGFDTLTSRIFAILYIETENLSMEELAEKTGYSMASVCNSMKSIEKSGFLKEKHSPGSKKTFFTIEKDFSRHVKMMVEMIRKSKILPAKEILPNLIERYRGVGAKEKQKAVESYYKQMLKIEKITNYIEAQI
jgi:DNA-binding transcriptional regulator GbsR (MarR family)